MSTPAYEIELSLPVKKWLSGKTVLQRGEVRGIDLAGQDSEGNLLIVELKRSLTLDLLCQGVERQKLTNLVWLAVPLPKKTTDWERKIHVVERLRLGLLVVCGHGKTRMYVREELAPQLCEPALRRSKKERQAVESELQRRSMDLNVSGQTRRPQMTAYRETVLTIAVILEYLGIASPKTISQYGVSNVNSILHDNYYNWIVKIGHGKYALSSEGRQALLEWADLVDLIRYNLFGTSPEQETGAFDLDDGAFDNDI